MSQDRVLIRDLRDGAVADVDPINEALVIEPSISANVHRGKLFDVTFVDQAVSASGTLAAVGSPNGSWRRQRHTSSGSRTSTRLLTRTDSTPTCSRLLCE